MFPTSAHAASELVDASLATTAGATNGSGLAWEATLGLSLAGTVLATLAWLFTRRWRSSGD